MARSTTRTGLLVGIGTIAALGLALAGCSGDPDSGPVASQDPGSDGSGGDVTITYANFISYGGNEAHLATIVDAFEADNPGITVDVTTLPYADHVAALQDVIGGPAPDVFDVDYDNYGAYEDSGRLARLEDVDTSAYREPLAEVYAPFGLRYALPSSFSDVVLFYNKDLFDAADLEYPTADWTWQDAQVAADALTDVETGVWGHYQPIGYHAFYKAVAQAGGEFLNVAGSKVKFNSPEGVAAAQWLVGKSGTTMPTMEQGAGTPDFALNLFTEGKLAMWHSDIGTFDALADAPFAWDIAVEPGGVRNTSVMYSNAVAVSSGTENFAAAQAFAEHLASSQIMVDVRLEAGWDLPPISDDETLSGFLDRGNPANRQAVFDSLEKVALVHPTIAEQAPMQDIVTEELTEAAAGLKSVEDALSSAEERVNSLLG